MNDFLLLMHNDAVDSQLANDAVAWQRYFALLQQSGSFAGGSEIGAGCCFRREVPQCGEMQLGSAKQQTVRPQASSDHLTGFIRIRVESMAAAEAFLSGNPVYEAGGTVEIRELPRD